VSSTRSQPLLLGSADPNGPMRIALVGTRGVPAKYGGFETAVEEVGKRLAERGHVVTVYCRRPRPRKKNEAHPLDLADADLGGGNAPDRYLGMDLIHLPAARVKSLETLSHTALASAHMTAKGRQQVAVVFNAANAPFLPIFRARGVPTATHVDGLEWQRAKWGGAGRRYYRTAEAFAVRWSDALIADAQGIADYYRREFGASTDLIRYGAPILVDPASDKLADLDLEPGGYHLVVARFEPENHVDIAIEGYLRSAARRPLIVVGSAPYAGQHIERINALAAGDDRVRLLGPVWDQDKLDQLYAHALTYIHGHSVGGTNPSLLRAIGAATAVSAFDVTFNREVLGTDGRYFADAAALAEAIDDAEADPHETAARGVRLQRIASTKYRWDDVADEYEALCRRLIAGGSQHGAVNGRRTRTT
jgi:glycosyltransferase involved in cell wall biosynthesis